MGDIQVHEFISVDGVVEDPRWTVDYPFDPKMGEAISTLMDETLLLGRRTYEMFAPAWSGRTAEDDPGAPFMNESAKYVVSGTLESADWNNSKIIGPYQAETVRELKSQIDGHIYVSGSVTLVRSLLADGLVEGLHLFVYPVALGSGLRLFADGSPRLPFSLDQMEAYDSGVVRLSYRPTA